MKYFVVLISLIIGLAVVTGFFIVGSPQEQRLLKFDERRIQDLQLIQSELINYWVNKEGLPSNLADLRDDLRGFSMPEDPQTNEEYGYKIRDDLNFALCANFSNSSPEISTPKPAYPEPIYQESWQHQAGYTCFERTIDPEIHGKQKRPYAP